MYNPYATLEGAREDVKHIVDMAFIEKNKDIAMVIQEQSEYIVARAIMKNNTELVNKRIEESNKKSEEDLALFQKVACAIMGIIAGASIVAPILCKFLK